MKKFLSPALALVLAVGLLAACGGGPDCWNEMVAKFEAAYPGVTVNMQISPTVGDIIRLQIVAALIKKKGLLDITDVFDGAGLEGTGTLRDQIADGVLETGKCAPPRPVAL